MAKLHVKPDSIVLERTDGTFIDLSHFEEVGPICWGYFWYKQGGKYGYMDEEGDLLCKPLYISAGNFDVSLTAPVQGPAGFGFINRGGVETCKLIYDKVWWYNNGYAQVQRDDNIYYIDRIGIEHQLPYAKKMWTDPRDKRIY